jgi:hypothetical protein
MPVPNSNIDFIAYDRDGHVLLLAEAKAIRLRAQKMTFINGISRSLIDGSSSVSFYASTH